MILSIAAEPGDDVAFLAALCGCVAKLVADRQPQVVYVLRISKWFDHKWLRYSGIGRVAFNGHAGLRGDRDTALDVVRSDRLTFPPFAPSLIDGQRTWRRTETGVYRRAYRLPHPHSRRVQSSTHNLSNRVADFSESALFVWFSSNTLTTGVAAVLVYGVSAGVTEAWYASFQRSSTWKVGRTKGIARHILQADFPLGSGAA